MWHLHGVIFIGIDLFQVQYTRSLQKFFIKASIPSHQDLGVLVKTFPFLVHIFFPGKAQSSGLAYFLFLCFKMFLFSYSEVSTLKDLFGLASSGKHLLWSWYEGLVCLWVEMLNECSCLSTHLGAKMSVYF